MKHRTEKALLTLLATRPMWGMIPLRIIFGVSLILSGLSRFTFVRQTSDTILAELPGEFALGLIIFFSVVEIIAGLLSVSGLFARAVGTIVLIEMSVAIFLERVIIDFRDLQTQVLLVAIASILFFSGGGRYSLDQIFAKKLLKKHPNKKKELYLLAETPYAKWWE
ncbi:MAG: DoxX family membrane protein [bacterium]|nr:DoxX family membrane protein [bacterium]